MLHEEEYFSSKLGDKVEVVGMPPEEECEREVFVFIRWNRDRLAVPLVQLKPVAADVQTTQAVEDWHYWIGAGIGYLGGDISP